MSLDVYLNGEKTEVDCDCTICGNRHKKIETPCFYQANITHNLGEMANEAGIYKALWRPEELGITKAVDLVPILNAGLSKLKNDPDRFKKFNPENGWGSYEGLVKFVEDYIVACVEYPNADIEISR